MFFCLRIIFFLFGYHASILSRDKLLDDSISVLMTISIHADKYIIGRVLVSSIILGLLPIN